MISETDENCHVACNHVIFACLTLTYSMFKVSYKCNYVCEQHPVLVLTLFASIITCKASGNLLTIPFREPIHHWCSTFPIRQEAAARDVSHPVATDAGPDNRREQSEGGDSCPIKSILPLRSKWCGRGSVV